jgi:hypothetical protein
VSTLSIGCRDLDTARPGGGDGARQPRRVRARPDPRPHRRRFLILSHRTRESYGSVRRLATMPSRSCSRISSKSSRPRPATDSASETCGSGARNRAFSAIPDGCHLGAVGPRSDRPAAKTRTRRAMFLRFCSPRSLARGLPTCSGRVGPTECGSLLLRTRPN